VWARWEHREVFAHPGYVSLFASDLDEPLAAYAEIGSGFVLYPFILRSITAPHLRAAGARDITTAYGYGGALAVGGAADHAPTFWTAFDAWCRERGVVSEFVRLSLFAEILLPYPGERQEKLTNVVRTLDLSEEELWRDFEHKVRKNVNKAKRSGVTVELDSTGAYLDDFLRIYTGTMERRDAKPSLCFPRRFFESIGRDLSGSCAYFHARHRGRVVSTELVLVSAENVYSYLGGTEEGAFDVRPNDLLKHELMLWVKRQGKKRFVIGGGNAPDDGIFRYKRAFAPDGLAPYFVGRRVLDRVAYDRLTANHLEEGRRRDPAWNHDGGFFPAYRCELPPGS
jgi:hypothetical protein